MTAATAGAGFKGGEIIPAMFIGATFGCTAAPFLGLDPVLGAEICLVAFFLRRRQLSGEQPASQRGIFSAAEIFFSSAWPLP